MKNKQITITSVESKQLNNGSVMYKIKDQDNLTYTIFQTKADGNETVAYSSLNRINTNWMNLNVEISYNEEDKEYQGKAYKQRTILNARFSNAPASTKINNQAKAKINNQDEEEKWEKINFGKCKHQFLLEAFKILGSKLNPTSQETPLNFNKIERDAEQWAEMSMRILPKTQEEQAMDTFGEDEVNVDEIPF